ncbi:MAG: ferritin-like domain-containing protein [Polynucleobacter sp.]
MLQPANAPAKWDLGAIPWDQLDTSLVRDREDLFYLVTAASFIEIAADLYSNNLALYFAEDREIVEWLESSWQKEEVRHGTTLRNYAQHAWPHFDWDSAYSKFFADYSRKCIISAYEPTHVLEMVARCVVETGTATFYQSLATQTNEPVLKGIALAIRAEEINHYKHFYAYFKKLNVDCITNRWQIFGAVFRRVLEARKDDAECAMWHVFNNCDSNRKQQNLRQFKLLYQQLSRQIKKEYPLAMAAKMLIKPLRLPLKLAQFIEGPVANCSTWILRH